MIYHVYPKNDIRPHNIQDTTCDCDPKIIEDHGNIIVVHNSFDGREAVEEANKILNENRHYDIR